MHKFIESRSRDLEASGQEEVYTLDYNSLTENFDVKSNPTFKIDVEFVNSLSSIVPGHSSLSILTELEGSSVDELLDNPSFLTSVLTEMLNFKLRNPNSSLVLPNKIDFNNIIETDFTDPGIKEILTILISDLKSIALSLRINRLSATDSATFQTVPDIVDRFGLVPDAVKQQLKEVNESVMNSENPIGTAFGMTLLFKYVLPSILPDKLKSVIVPFEKATTALFKTTIACMIGDPVCELFAGRNFTSMIKQFLPFGESRNQFVRNLDFRLNTNEEVDAFVLSFTPQQATGGIIDPVFSQLTFADALDSQKFPPFKEFQSKSPYYGVDIKRYNTAKKLFKNLRKALDNKAKVDPEFKQLYENLLKDRSVKWPSGFLSLVSAVERSQINTRGRENLVVDLEKPIQSIETTNPILDLHQTLSEFTHRPVYNTADESKLLVAPLVAPTEGLLSEADNSSHKEKITQCLNMNLTDFEENPNVLNPNYGYLFKKALTLTTTSGSVKPYVSSLGIEYYTKKFTSYDVNNLSSAITDVLVSIKTKHPSLSDEDIRNNLNLVFGGGDGTSKQYFGFTFNPRGTIAHDLATQTEFEHIQISNFNPDLPSGINQPILSLSYRYRYAKNIDNIDKTKNKEKILAELKKIIEGSRVQLPKGFNLEQSNEESGQIMAALSEVYDSFENKINAATGPQQITLRAVRNRELVYIAAQTAIKKVTNAASSTYDTTTNFLTSIKDSLIQTIQTRGVVESIPHLLKMSADYFTNDDPTLAYANHFSTYVSELIGKSNLSDENKTAFKQDASYIVHLFSLAVSDFIDGINPSNVLNAVNKILQKHGIKSPSLSSNTFTADLSDKFKELIAKKLLPAFAAQ